jgi:hypothetical protein
MVAPFTPGSTGQSSNIGAAGCVRLSQDGISDAALYHTRLSPERKAKNQATCAWAPHRSTYWNYSPALLLPGRGSPPYCTLCLLLKKAL